MSSLVPEIRVDVNGRHVTRHVKSGNVPQNLLRSIPEPHLYSHEFSSSFANAQSVSELIYTFNDNGQMIDAYGKECHDFGFEEAVDALSDMLPSKTLILLRQKLERADGRLKQILAEQVYSEILDSCEDRRNNGDAPTLSMAAKNTIRDGIELSALADDFAGSDAEMSDILSSMYNATRSIRRECSSPEWKEILTDDEKLKRLVESEFVVNFVSNSRIEYQSPDQSPEDIFKNRMKIMDNYGRIKTHQAEFKERGEINVGILDEMDRMNIAVREGTL